MRAQNEALSMNEIPHPRELSPVLSCVESEEWFACGPPPIVGQGWKLYVPATFLNARKLVELVCPLASHAGLHFKYIKTTALLRKLNAGIFGYTQVGKGVVIYLPEPDKGFLNALKDSLVPYRDQCPAVPCAMSFGDDLPLYYRYGAYVKRRLQVGGYEIEDDRTNAKSAVPAGIEDLLRNYTSPQKVPPEVQSFLLRYPAHEAIQQQGKGGIFIGLNLASETFQEVILKVGYHRGLVQLDGSDGCTLLRRELAFYRELANRGIAAEAPQLIDALDTPRKVILVLEYIPGSNLLLRRLQNQLTVMHLERCWSILARLHATGLYLGDAKLANFLAADDGKVWVLDFETAGVIGDKPSPIRTFNIKPGLADVCAADLAHFLASVLYAYDEEDREDPRDTNFDLRIWAARNSENEIAAWAHEKLQKLLDQPKDSGMSPSTVALAVERENQGNYGSTCKNHC
jgi:hypothetical protein